MTSRVVQALAELRHEVTTPGTGLDRLRLVEVPFVPEVRLYLARGRHRVVGQDGSAGWREATASVLVFRVGRGKAIARYVLDHPAAVAGRRVLDLAAGSGLVAIAAGKAGAAAVTANDVDPYAVAAITLNAKANGVLVTECLADLLDGDGGDAETVLAGDIFYTGIMAQRVLAFLERVAARGAQVLVGDPGREHLPRGRMQTVATYRLPLVDPSQTLN